MFFHKRHFRYSLTIITLLMVVFIAVLAGGALWILRSMHQQTVHASATVSVVELGKLIVSHLAEQPEVKGGVESGRIWGDFARQVRSLYAVESALQYVSVMKDGVTVFSEQRETLDVSGDYGATGVAGKTFDGGIKLSRRLLSVGGSVLPVVVFMIETRDSQGLPVVVEVAVRKEAVDRAESTAGTAVKSMFEVALITIVISFGACILLVAWMMRREHLRELKRRDEEHLTFAGVMANGIVHDFRNPMSSLKLDVQMLSRLDAKGVEAGDRAKKISERILKTIDRMDKVFQEFLFASRPPKDEMDRVDLCAEVRECLAMLESRIEQARIKVEVDIPERPVMVNVYSASFHRALMNILINAEQFARKDEGSVTVRMRRGEGRVVLDVSDNGPGVSEKDRERIFDMFVSTRPGGTGLGLFFAKTAIDRAGGMIEVLDAPGGGACFRITIQESVTVVMSDVGRHLV